MIPTIHVYCMCVHYGCHYYQYMLNSWGATGGNQHQKGSTNVCGDGRRECGDSRWKDVSEDGWVTTFTVPSYTVYIKHWSVQCFFSLKCKKQTVGHDSLQDVRCCSIEAKCKTMTVFTNVLSAATTWQLQQFVWGRVFIYIVSLSHPKWFLWEH